VVVLLVFGDHKTDRGSGGLEPDQVYHLENSIKFANVQ